MSSRTNATPDRRRVLLLAGVATAVVVVTGIAIALSGGSDEPASDAAVGGAYGPVIVEGAALPRFESTSDDAAIGLDTPRVEGVDPDGNPVSIGVGTGAEPTMLVFLAHWCPHCQRELPVIVQLITRGDLDGIRSVAILTGTSPDRPNFPPQAWLDREGWTGEVLLDDEVTAAATSFGLSSYPYLVFLDANGSVVARASGELPASEVVALADLAREAG